MGPPKPFPLFRLPFLAIEEAFKAMHPFEIINFSMISKRTKTVTKHMSFFSKYSIGIDIDEEQQVSVVGPEYTTECVYIFTSNEEMNGKVVEEGDWDDMYELRAWKYSKNPVEEWMQLLKHVLDIFKKQSIDSFTMTMDAFVDQNVSIIDFLKSNVKSVDNCNLYQLRDETNVDDHNAYLLKNITISSKLFLLLDIKNNNFNAKIPKNLKELTILESKWIGYERLLEIDCKSVTLKNYKILDEQWNLFFKKWISMETNQNLEYLELDNRDLEEFRDRVLHDIPYEVVSEEISRIVTCRYNPAQKINGGIDIRRIDGKTATFFLQFTGSEESLLMCIH
ncbi:hypothetical protein CRE_30497 [Caenorhabditis remanei]|uniref:F-box domain-containing protein n=1 Tax=Caenorhabditis remanei TaxID=31234 RepID=E3NI70_CAERE|nr:hypothetical protein CRE_30497 [Caenorhabditis remanei]